MGLEKLLSSAVRGVRSKVAAALLAASMMFGYCSEASAEPVPDNMTLSYGLKDPLPKYPSYLQDIPDVSAEQGVKGTINSRKTSLFEATIYTGIPALGTTLLFWAATDEFDPNISENLSWGFHNPPKWDNNPWYINYVGHPEFGAECYLVARNRDYSMFSSFLYSTGCSVAWEYAIEPFIGARPSRQDLLITSTAGALFGELRYWGKNRLMKKQHKNSFDKALIFLLDPIDAVYRAVE